MAVRTTMRWVTKADLAVLVQGAESPSDDEWADFLKALSACMQTSNGHIRVLVFTDGGAPNAAQRQMAIKAGWENNRSPIAIVSPNVLVRSMITAFSWFNMNIRAFSDRDTDDAFDFLRLMPIEIEWVQRQRQ